MSKCAIIIPALNPSKSLVDYVQLLLAKGIPQVIVVNDGSKEELESIFNELNMFDGCTVLTHETNKGKGRALKTAFQYFLQMHHDLDGVVTADADGQHSIPDVIKIAAMLGNDREEMILGVRDFSMSNVPVRSLIGNRITSYIFQLFYGGKLEDTQTGLRGIPKAILSPLIALKGERYEYEMNMLIFARKKNIMISKTSIQTLYFNNNADSHYSSLIDSLRVFFKLISGLLRYSMSTIASGIIDILSFLLLISVLLKNLPLGIRVLLATFGARVLSSSCNFYMNRKIVFASSNNLKKAFVKYYILFFALIAASYLLVISANLFLNLDVVLSKICIDTVLGILSYQIQLHWVFKSDKRKINKIAGENHDL
ncbi:bifunctional glycosyltransferase family 2/GtrA family protein [Bacillus sp. BRMEA1]|uniref:glycosyltransferase n=1 Tax=Neobacillus endophyticus TaxID=2738405 RepID=UPI0015675529|nr:glycosyltransferase [Neobacillus endophyticus]NRD79262.1 bifunctional glycosyltransferase family 2/GtrA family protein [Neobacillus endophyticus]